MQAFMAAMSQHGLQASLIRAPNTDPGLDGVGDSST